MFAALTEGYLASAGAFLNADERANLAFAGWLMTYEVGYAFSPITWAVTPTSGSAGRVRTSIGPGHSSRWRATSSAIRSHEPSDRRTVTSGRPQTFDENPTIRTASPHVSLPSPNPNARRHDDGDRDVDALARGEQGAVRAGAQGCELGEARSPTAQSFTPPGSARTAFTCWICGTAADSSRVSSTTG